MNINFLRKACKSALARRIIGQTILLSSVITFFGTLIQLHYTYSEDLNAVEEAVSEIERSRVASMVESVWLVDDLQIKNQLEGIAKIKDIVFASVKEKGKITWATGDSEKNNVEGHSITLTKNYRGELIELGELVVYADLDAIRDRVANSFFVILTINAVKTLCVTLFFVVIFYYSVGRHIIKISNFSSVQRPGKELKRLVLDRASSGREKSDEIDVLASSINSLFEDIEDYRREKDFVELDLQQQREDLAKANEQLQEFTYRASHDLRAPIISSLALLKFTDEFISENSLGEAKSCILMANKSLTTLKELVDNLIEINMGESQKKEPVWIDVDELIKKVSLSLKYLDGIDELRLIVNTDKINRLFVEEHKLLSIVEHIVSNAVKYRNPEKSIESVLDITTNEEDGCFVLKARDNGLGIPKEYEKDLFSMFKRFHPTVGSGSGLGMYLMKKNAISLGGDVGFVRNDIGSTVVLRLPLEGIEAV